MKNVNFETAILELENIVKKLENGSVGLDESIALYEEGIILSNACNDMLKKAKQKIEIIKNDNYIKNELDMKLEVSE